MERGLIVEYLDISLGLIHASPTNPRKTFPAEEMAEMVDSVKRHGVLQPILVRPWPTAYAYEGDIAPAYELVAGERRYRAAKGAKLEMIPATVRHLSDHEVLEIQIIENLQRKGLHELEEAEGYELMIQQHGYTADGLAEKIGKSRAYIYGRMKLTALCMPARLAFRDGKLTASTALLIARIPGETLQVKALEAITSTWKGVLSTREAASVIQSDFCCYLNDAAFPQENLLLVPAAGGCSTCPKRSGASPELFPDIERADVCTDLDCYKAKSTAWLAYQKAQAEAVGKKVIAGDEARKINIAYSHDKFVPLDRRNYEIEGSPTYRDAIEKIDVEVVLIEDERNGKMVEAVEKKALASALQAAGLKAEPDYRERERELERKVRAENEFRRRLYEAWHNEMRGQLETDEAPDFETEELAMVAATLWSSLYGESQESVMGYWAAQSDKKEHWERRNAMIREVAGRIASMNRRELILFLMDCALASDARCSGSSVDHTPSKLIDRAEACGIKPAEIREAIANEKAAKTKKSTAKKSAPTPSEAPQGGEVDCGNGRFEKGDRVKVKAEARGPNGIKRKCAGREGVIDVLVATSATPGLEMYVVAFDGHEAISGLRGEELELLPPSTEAARTGGTTDPETAAEAVADEKPTENVKRFHSIVKAIYAHPENAELTWTGRGRKPKWVENWLNTGSTLDQLRVADETQDSSAPAGANAKQCAAEMHARCTKTLELPLN